MVPWPADLLRQSDALDAPSPTPAIRTVVNAQPQLHRIQPRLLAEDRGRISDHAGNGTGATMSDDPSPAKEPIRVPAGIITHGCEKPGCERWGSFGEPHGKETRWFCGEHRPKD